MGHDTRPDGNKNIQILRPDDWGNGAAFNSHLIHSLIH